LVETQSRDIHRNQMVNESHAVAKGHIQMIEMSNYYRSALHSSAE